MIANRGTDPINALARYRLLREDTFRGGEPILVEGGQAPFGSIAAQHDRDCGSGSLFVGLGGQAQYRFAA